MTKKVVNDVLRDMTPKEQARYDAKKQAGIANAPTRKLKRIKMLRLERLQKTDWMGNNDYTMPENIKTWRQALRDIPQDNTTEAEYDLILAADADGVLTNAIWNKP